MEKAHTNIGAAVLCIIFSLNVYASEAKIKSEATGFKLCVPVLFEIDYSYLLAGEWVRINQAAKADSVIINDRVCTNCRDPLGKEVDKGKIKLSNCIR